MNAIDDEGGFAMRFIFAHTPNLKTLDVSCTSVCTW